MELFELVNDQYPADLLPVRQHDGDAGYDLRTYSIDKRQMVQLVHTGVRVRIPTGYVGLIRERSSWARDGLIVTGGVIDAGYDGEIVVVCHHYHEAIAQITSARLDRYPRFAQLVIVPVWTPDTSARRGKRGAGGFGSTGQE